MRLHRRSKRGVPTLNTAALPDLIFTVLFFFMIVTHMRNSDVKVRYEVPKGTDLSKVAHKSAITYLYIGKDTKGQTTIQVNNDIVELSKLASVLKAEKDKLPEDEQDYHTVSVKADRDTPLSVIAAVKATLSQANTLQVSYSATKKIKSEQQE